MSNKRQRSGRYFLDQDNSSHWYQIPVELRDEWVEWCQLDEEDEASWQAPAEAIPLGSHPSLLEFENVTTYTEDSND